MSRFVRRSFALVLALQLAAYGSAAGDGEIEINQASAEAGGVTPGDGPGFPVTLDRPGAYRLTGNLASPIATGAIVIAATNVTLDLGGFLVSSTNACTGYPTTSCAVEFGVSGIAASASQFLVVVRNGSVSRMGGNCIQLLGPSSVVEDVRAFGCGTVGIGVGTGARVVRSFSGSNLLHGIGLGDGATAEGNEARANGIWGIVAVGPLGGNVIANRAYQNGQIGITVSGPVLVSRNVATANSIVQINVLSPAKSLFDNLCDGALC